MICKGYPNSTKKIANLYRLLSSDDCSLLYLINILRSILSINPQDHLKTYLSYLSFLDIDKTMPKNFLSSIIDC